MPELAHLNTQVLGISVDSVPCKAAWAKELGVNSFPLVSDFWPHGALAETYGILREEGFSERAIFIVDSQGVLRFVKVYDTRELPDLDEVLALCARLPV